MKRLVCATAIALTLTASPAFAWGDLGHDVIAKIAYAHLTPAARAKIDALLAADAVRTTACPTHSQPVVPVLDLQPQCSLT